MTTDPNPAEDAPRQELARKAALEAALVAAPEDAAVRERYFDELLRFASVRTGLTYALLPELGFPLALRCGSADVLGLQRAFRERLFAFPMRATPRRILVLGAHVGFGTMALALRFPGAQVIAIEPNAAALRILSLNILPLRRVQALSVAAWHSPTRLGVHSRMLGDWGLQLHDQMPDGERTVPARAVGDILRLAGWDQVDMVVCDILGAELAVFADPNQRWLHTLDTLAVMVQEPRRAAFEELALACFDPAVYGRERYGDVQVIERHTPLRAFAAPPPVETPLIGSEPALQPVGLQDTPQTGWGFFVFDGDCCQVHPNAGGERPARAIFPCRFAGQTRFSATLHHAGRPSPPILFTVLIQTPEGDEVFRAAHSLAAGARQEVTFDLPELAGPHHVVLQTEMADAGAQNFNAWAQFLAPRLG